MIRNSNGYVALMAVLIVGAAATAISLSLLVAGTNSQQSSGVTQQSIQARQLANACAEEALQKINENVAFLGTATITMGAGSCTYTVAKVSTVYTITTSGTVNNVVKKVVVYATISASNISITSWQEVI